MDVLNILSMIVGIDTMHLYQVSYWLERKYDFFQFKDYAQIDVFKPIKLFAK